MAGAHRAKVISVCSDWIAIAYVSASIISLRRTVSMKRD